MATTLYIRYWKRLKRLLRSRQGAVVTLTLITLFFPGAISYSAEVKIAWDPPPNYLPLG